MSEYKNNFWTRISIVTLSTRQRYSQIKRSDTQSISSVWLIAIYWSDSARKKAWETKINYNHAESVYYNCRKNGYLKTGGKTKELSDCGSRNGDLVECLADLKDGSFSWRHTARTLEHCRVPEAMRGKPIYLSILLLYPGNKVEVKMVEWFDYQPTLFMFEHYLWRIFIFMHRLTLALKLFIWKYWKISLVMISKR